MCPEMEHNGPKMEQKWAAQSTKIGPKMVVPAVATTATRDTEMGP